MGDASRGHRQALSTKGLQTGHGAGVVGLTGPDGTVITVDEGSLGAHGSYLVAVDKDAKETVILVDAPAAGAWTVELLEGSSPLADASSAEGLEEAEVTASVSGDTPPELSWELTPRPGQVVRFVETAEGISQVVAETEEATGSVPFSPAAGPAGSRTLVAEVFQDGLPRGSIEVATYDAPAVAMLTVGRAGTGAGTITSDPAGIDCGDSCGLVLTEPVELTATADPGSRFVGWTGACGGTGTCAVTGEESTGVTALFAKVVARRITGLSPSVTRPGRTVTLTGAGLAYVTSVSIGKVKVAAFSVVSASKLTFVVPEKARSGKVTVAGPDGSATSPRKLTIKRKR